MNATSLVTYWTSLGMGGLPTTTSIAFHLTETRLLGQTKFQQVRLHGAFNMISTVTSSPVPHFDVAVSHVKILAKQGCNKELQESKPQLWLRLVDKRKSWRIRC